MTIRQTWVRIQALPVDAPLWAQLAAAEAERDRTAKHPDSAAIDDTLASLGIPLPTDNRDERSSP